VQVDEIGEIGGGSEMPGVELAVFIIIERRVP
jgi:hypothetical protein